MNKVNIIFLRSAAVIFFILTVITIRTAVNNPGLIRDLTMQPDASLIDATKKEKGKKCFLLGEQNGWHLPEYEITTDSLKVDSFFHVNVPKKLIAWQSMERDSFYLQQISNNKTIYAEYGYFIFTKKGRKKFIGASDRRYAKKRFK